MAAHSCKLRVDLPAPGEPAMRLTIFRTTPPPKQTSHGPVAKRWGSSAAEKSARRFSPEPAAVGAAPAMFHAPHDGQRDLRAGNTSRHTRHGRWLGRRYW